MTDLELAAKKLSEIEAFIGELRSVGRPQLVTVDLRERRFVEHTLQLAIQASLDLASHIVSNERWGEPESRARFTF
ncbi:MAG TPA: HepT-like ribonuclease domain-containing protein [Polyangiaceae bacterium]|nr:HepT-like ribonuclease domain-containing protein [Polyangiaceae bacterium]